jgi:YihY family inner membrane protein
MNIFEKTARRIDTFQRSHKRSGFVYGVIKKYGDDEAGHQAALMAYYGFLSLFPLLLVLATVIKLTFRNESELRRTIIDGASNYFPMIGNDLQKSVHSMGGTGLALVVGILVTLYGARGVADVFRSMVNHVWEVPHARRTGFPWAQLRSARMIIVGGAGLLLAPIVSGYAAAAGHGPLFWLASLAITQVILFGIFLFLIFTSLPHAHSFHELWPSALMAAVGLQILQSLGGLLVTHQLKHLDDLYGTFAIVLGLLFWLYLQAQVIVYAFEAGTVRVFRLYPRSLILEKPTAADRRAYHLYADRNRFHNDAEMPKMPPYADV